MSSSSFGFLSDALTETSIKYSNRRDRHDVGFRNQKSAELGRVPAGVCRDENAARILRGFESGGGWDSSDLTNEGPSSPPVPHATGRPRSRAASGAAVALPRPLVPVHHGAWIAKTATASSVVPVT
jgi:hypothetical protein